MGNMMTEIDTFTQDWLTYGRMARCPNCDHRIILSYPYTQCVKCQNRFRNDVTVVKYVYGFGGPRNTTLYSEYGPYPPPPPLPLTTSSSLP